MKQLQIRVLLVFLGLAVLAGILDKSGVLNAPKAWAQAVVLPVQFGIVSFRNSVMDTFSVLTFWQSGEARVKQLEAKNLELTSRAVEVERLARENADLRAQLGVKQLLVSRQLPGEVLGFSRYLEIGVGARDGVKNGAAVVYLGNLVGRVVRVLPASSFVELPTDVDAKIPVKVGAAGIIRGLTLGQFNSSILLTHVASNEEINSDDMVLTSGEGSPPAGEAGLPADLIVGKVGKIESSESDLFKSAMVVPLVNFGKLVRVFVVLD